MWPHSASRGECGLCPALSTHGMASKRCSEADRCTPSRTRHTGTGFTRINSGQLLQPFAFDFLRLRRCALFFLSLLAIRFSECLLSDFDKPFVFVSSIFSCNSAIQFLLSETNCGP